MTQHIKRAPLIPYIAPSGTLFLIPAMDALTEKGEPISEWNLVATCPRVITGDAAANVAYNPVSGYCEVRVNGVRTDVQDTLAACERMGAVFPVFVTKAPLPAAIEAQESEQPEGAWEAPVSPDDSPEDKPADDLHKRPRDRREARNDVERARFAFWGAAYQEGVVVRGKLENTAQRDARLACVAAYLGIGAISSLSELDAGQIDRVTGAIRRGDVRCGWKVLELVAQAAGR